MTYTTGAKYTDQKIFPLDVEGCRCVFAFAGDGGLGAEVRDKSFRKLGEFLRHADAEVSSEEFRAAAEEVVNDQNRTLVDLPLEFLLAAYPSKDGPVLFHFDGRSFNRTKRLTVLGCGNDSLMRFLSERLYKENLPQVEAVSVAAYLVKKATKYVNGCGEPIEAFLVKAGEVKKIDDWAAAAIQTLEHVEQSCFDDLLKKAYEWI